VISVTGFVMIGIGTEGRNEGQVRVVDGRKSQYARVSSCSRKGYDGLRLKRLADLNAVIISRMPGSELRHIFW
jgi:hypothetical protein